MAIDEKLNQLRSIKNDIKTAINKKSSTKVADDMTKYAAAIDAIEEGGIVPADTITIIQKNGTDVSSYAYADVFEGDLAKPIIENVELAISENSLTITATGTSKAATSGWIGKTSEYEKHSVISKTVSLTNITESKEIEPTDIEQTVTPTDGKLLSSVIVKASKQPTGTITINELNVDEENNVKGYATAEIQRASGWTGTVSVSNSEITENASGDYDIKGILSAEATPSIKGWATDATINGTDKQTIISLSGTTLTEYTGESASATSLTLGKAYELNTGYIGTRSVFQVPEGPIGEKSVTLETYTHKFDVTNEAALTVTARDATVKQDITATNGQIDSVNINANDIALTYDTENRVLTASFSTVTNVGMAITPTAKPKYIIANDISDAGWVSAGTRIGDSTDIEVEQGTVSVVLSGTVSLEMYKPEINWKEDTEKSSHAKINDIEVSLGSDDFNTSASRTSQNFSIHIDEAKTRTLDGVNGTYVLKGEVTKEGWLDYDSTIEQSKSLTIDNGSLTIVSDKMEWNIWSEAGYNTEELDNLKNKILKDTTIFGISGSYDTEAKGATTIAIPANEGSFTLDAYYNEVDYTVHGGNMQLTPTVVANGKVETKSVTDTISNTATFNVSYANNKLKVNYIDSIPVNAIDPEIKAEVSDTFDAGWFATVSASAKTTAEVESGTVNINLNKEISVEDLSADYTLADTDVTTTPTIDSCTITINPTISETSATDTQGFHKIRISQAEEATTEISVSKGKLTPKITVSKAGFINEGSAIYTSKEFEVQSGTATGKINTTDISITDIVEGFTPGWIIEGKKFLGVDGKGSGFPTPTKTVLLTEQNNNDVLNAAIANIQPATIGLELSDVSNPSIGITGESISLDANNMTWTYDNYIITVKSNSAEDISDKIAITKGSAKPAVTVSQKGWLENGKKSEEGLDIDIDTDQIPVAVSKPVSLVDVQNSIVTSKTISSMDELAKYIEKDQNILGITGTLDPSSTEGSGKINITEQGSVSIADVDVPISTTVSFVANATKGNGGNISTKIQSTAKEITGVTNATPSARFEITEAGWLTEGASWTVTAATPIIIASATADITGQTEVNIDILSIAGDTLNTVDKFASIIEKDKYLFNIKGTYEPATQAAEYDFNYKAASKGSVASASTTYSPDVTFNSMSKSIDVSGKTTINMSATAGELTPEIDVSSAGNLSVGTHKGDTINAPDIQSGTATVQINTSIDPVLLAGTDASGTAVLTSANIKNGITIFGVEGSYQGETSGSTAIASYNVDSPNDVSKYSTAYFDTSSQKDLKSENIVSGCTICGIPGSLSISEEHVISDADVTGSTVSAKNWLTCEVPALSASNFSASTTGITGTKYITVTPATTSQAVFVNNKESGGWYSKDGYVLVKGDSKLIPENIKTNIEIFGITGTYGGGGSGEKVIEKSSFTYNSELDDYTTDVDVYKYASMSKEDYQSLIPDNIKEGKSILGVKGTYSPTSTDSAYVTTVNKQIIANQNGGDSEGACGGLVNLICPGSDFYEQMSISTVGNIEVGFDDVPANRNLVVAANYQADSGQLWWLQDNSGTHTGVLSNCTTLGLQLAQDAVGVALFQGTRENNQLKFINFAYYGNVYDNLWILVDNVSMSNPSSEIDLQGKRYSVDTVVVFAAASVEELEQLAENKTASEWEDVVKTINVTEYPTND